MNIGFNSCGSAPSLREWIKSDPCTASVVSSSQTFVPTGIFIDVTPSSLGVKLDIVASAIMSIASSNAGFAVALAYNGVISSSPPANWAFFGWNRDEGYNAQVNRRGLYTSTSLAPVRVELMFCAYDPSATTFLANYHHYIKVREVHNAV